MIFVNELKGTNGVAINSNYSLMLLDYRTYMIFHLSFLIINLLLEFVYFESCTARASIARVNRIISNQILLTGFLFFILNYVTAVKGK